MNVTCGHCAHAFKPDQSGRKFCSNVCYHASRVGKGNAAAIRPSEDRVCPVCGRTYTVGSPVEGHEDRRKRVCSQACNGIARTKHGAVVKELAPTDAAYVAAMIDGEGSISLTQDRHTLALRVNVANTDLPMLEWIRDMTGVGVINSKTSDATRRAIHYWECNGAVGVAVLAVVLPFLRIKRVQAELAIEVDGLRRATPFGGDRSWQQDYRERMRFLNRRGPR